MIVDLDDQEEKPTESGIFDLAGGGKIDLRLLSARDVREMQKLCVKTTVEYPLLRDPKTGEESYRRFEVPKFDGDLWNEEQWNRTITGWSDLFDAKQKPIPCTRENKILLMSKKADGKDRAPEFVKAYDAGQKILKDRDREHSEALEKN